MDDVLTRLQYEIEKLSAAVASLAHLPETQAVVQDQLDHKRQQYARRAGIVGRAQAAGEGAPGEPPHLSRRRDATRPLDMRSGAFLSDSVVTGGTVIGTNLGRIVFGRDPDEDEQQRLRLYLEKLAAKLDVLPLRGLDDRPHRGIRLSEVYITLATTSTHTWTVRGQAELLRYVDDLPTRHLRPEYSPETALPSAAVLAITEAPDSAGGEGAAPSDQPAWRLKRALLCTEVLRSEQHLVLCGDPGSGKSTFLRHMAWALAQRGLDRVGEDTGLVGWQREMRLLPIILPLRILADRLAREGLRDRTMFDALCEALAEYCVPSIDDALAAALDRGKVLLLLDGLDEVPLEAIPGRVASRLETVLAVRDFMVGYPMLRAVVTCRTRAFDDGLRDELGWPVAEIASFTLGQIRHFVPAWYRQLMLTGQISAALGTQLSTALIDKIASSDRLHELAGTPLLLTLMSLVLYNKGELPRDRPKLYQRILELMLGQWDHAQGREGMGQAIGLPEWESNRFLDLLDRLSYEAHRDAKSSDGRGRLDRAQLHMQLIDFFRLARVSNPGEVALKWLEYVDQRSGLLAPDGPTSYAFAHLTLQEHCAGRYIALGVEDLVPLVRAHRADDRWHEPIMLGMGVARPAELYTVLVDLIDRKEDFSAKAPERWYRDLILAAEIGADRDWDYLRTRPSMRVEQLQRDLRAGLTDLLDDTQQVLAVRDRRRAAELLGELGDCRIPTAPDDWWRASASFRDGAAPPEGAGEPVAGYWRLVPGGRYRIGGWQPGQPGAEVPVERFWIARYPVTVSQYRQFIDEGGYDHAQHWTAEGWRHRQRYDRRHPYRWGNAAYCGANQPVTGVWWYEAAAFCIWLTRRLGDFLPPGYVVRLPSDAEWEVAAAYPQGEGERRTYPWGEDAAVTPDHAIYEGLNLKAAAPVGICALGAAPCGALDLVGNVWEWTASLRAAYPTGSAATYRDVVPDGVEVSARGGGWSSAAGEIGGHTRIGRPPYRYYDHFGFRAVVAPG